MGKMSQKLSNYNSALQTGGSLQHDGTLVSTTPLLEHNRRSRQSSHHKSQSMNPQNNQNI